jgi:hypothetical protein
MKTVYPMTRRPVRKAPKDRASASFEMPEITEAMELVFKKSGSLQREESFGATLEMAQALELPLQQGVLYGDIIDGVFLPVNFAETAVIEFPLDFLAPGTEKNHVAYSIPNHGRIPERHVEGDIVRVNTYEIANSIDWLLKYSRDARWDVAAGALRVLRAGFTKKMNDDGFHVLLASAVARNIVVYDSLAGAGSLTKRLISLLQQVMRRSGGGNSTSVNRSRLTDLFISPEALEDVRNWSYAELDEVTRREIFIAADGELNRIFGVNLHDIDELGVGQQYQNFYTNELGGTMASGDVEIVIGLDLSQGPGAGGTLMMPIRQPLQLFPDDNMHRQRRTGFYGWTEIGFTNLSGGRNVILGSL